MSTFKKIWEDAWSARMEYILTNTLLALLEAPGSTLLGVNRMLSDKDYRREIVSHIKDPSVKAFWTKEFASYTERMAAEAVPAIQNKVGQFTANPLIRNMIGQPHSSFDFREAMDRRKIILINLSKGKIGDENMKLLGGLLVTKIYLAAMSRSDVHDRAMKLLPNFYLFVDEFQNFANASFADILSEARKYKLNLTIAHQYVEQMDELVRPAVFGNVGTMIIFRVGATDAEALENEFTPQFTIEDLVNLGFAQIYLKLMIDGLTSPPFSAVTLPPIPHPDSSYVQEIIAASRKQFSRPRADVEAEVIKFHEPIPKPPPAAVTATAKPSSTAKTPSPKTPAAAQPMPPKQPAPAPTHKPFAVLKQVVVPTPSAAKPSAQPVSPASSASTPVPQASTPVPVQPAPAPVKPVPLSFLAPKPAPRVDPKVPVKKNVDDLRSALSAALGGKLPTPVPAQEPLRETSLAKPIEKTQPARPPQETASAEPAAPKREAPKGPPKEVPEEILKKLLKMEE
jgi:hypothetical protein